MLLTSDSRKYRRIFSCRMCILTLILYRPCHCIVAQNFIVVVRQPTENAILLEIGNDHESRDKDDQSILLVLSFDRPCSYTEGKMGKCVQ